LLRWLGRVDPPESSLLTSLKLLSPRKQRGYAVLSVSC
jgi:hypothetical protein